MSSSKFPCGACKYLRRKCGEECVFAPHFPQDQTDKFETVHKVYGASTVGRILSELPAAERGAAVSSLVYEAEARLKDPVYGCVGSISILQHKLKQVQTELNTAKQELATYMGPCVLNPGFMRQFINQQRSVGLNIASNMDPMSGLQQQGISENAQQDMLRNLNQKYHQHQQHVQNQQQSMDLSRFNRCFDGAGPSHQHNQQSYQAQQLIEAAREQDIIRNLEHQHHHQQQIQNQQQLMDILRFNRSFDGAGPSSQASHSGFTHLTGPGEMSPSLPFGGSYDGNVCQIQQQPQEEVCNHLQNHQSQLRQYPQQEQNHNLQSLLPHQVLLQQQNQRLQHENQRMQRQPHPQQEQHDHLHQLIQHQLMLQHENQQSQLQQHPQQEQHQHLQSLLPHQLLLQNQNHPLQPQPHPQEEETDQLQQLIPLQLLLQQQTQPSQSQPQPHPNHEDGSEEGSN